MMPAALGRSRSGRHFAAREGGGYSSFKCGSKYAKPGRAGARVCPRGSGRGARAARGGGRACCRRAVIEARGAFRRGGTGRSFCCLRLGTARGPGISKLLRWRLVPAPSEAYCLKIPIACRGGKELSRGAIAEAVHRAYLCLNEGFSWQPDRLSSPILCADDPGAGPRCWLTSNSGGERGARGQCRRLVRARPDSSRHAHGPRRARRRPAVAAPSPRPARGSTSGRVAAMRRR